MTNLNSLIKEIRIDTAYAPPLIVNDPFQPGASNWWLNQLKPKITIIPRSPYLKPMVSAPWGDPGVTKWPEIRTVLEVAGVATVAALVVKMIGRYR